MSLVLSQVTIFEHHFESHDLLPVLFFFLTRPPPVLLDRISTGAAPRASVALKKVAGGSETDGSGGISQCR
jgi:hypothetical protein